MPKSIKYALSVLWRELKENWHNEFEFPETDRVRDAERKAILKLSACFAVCDFLRFYPDPHRTILEMDYGPSHVWIEGGRRCLLRLTRSHRDPCHTNWEYQKNRKAPWNLPSPKAKIVLASWPIDKKGDPLGSKVQAIEIEFDAKKLIEIDESDAIPCLVLNEEVIDLAHL